MSAVVAEECSTFDLIRTVAGELFCQAGYKGTGMRSLAAAVGIQPGSLYNHIESKQALLYELITDYEMHLLQIFKGRPVSRCTNAVRMNSLLWEAVTEFVAENRHLARLARDQIQHLSRDQARSISGIRLRRQRQLQVLLAQCSDELGLSTKGREGLGEELDALLNCYVSLSVDGTVDSNGVVKRQLQNMASMLLVKRD